MSAKKKRYRRMYQNDATKILCVWLIINTIIFIIYNLNILRIDLRIVNNISVMCREFIDITYTQRGYVIISFLLIGFTCAKILLIAHRIPIVLICAMLFIIRFDYDVASFTGDKGLELRTYLERIPISEKIEYAFIEANSRFSNIGLTVSGAMPVYLFLKKSIFDNVIAPIREETNKSSKSVNKSTNKQTNNTSGQKSYSSSSNYNNSNSYNNSSSYDEYDDDDYNYNDDYYNSKKSSGLGYNLFSSPYEEKFTVITDYDKEVAHDMVYTNPNGKIIDECGIERTVWEYANEYEAEKRREEEEKRLQDELYYNNYYNNDDYYNNDNYGYIGNNDYYNNDNYSYIGNDDYYNSFYKSDDYYDSYYNNNDNDSGGWF